MRFRNSYIPALHGVLICALVGGCTIAGPDASSNSSSSSTHARGERLGKVTEAFTPQQGTQTLSSLLQIVATIAPASAGLKAATSVISSLLQVIGVLSTDPQAMANQLAALAKEVNAVGGTLSWQIAEGDRESRVADLTGDVLDVGQTVQLGQTVSGNSPAVSDSINKTLEAEKPIAFLRFYDDSLTNGKATSDVPWKSLIPDRPTVADGLVYDWRLSVPALMQLIALRLQVIAAEDPNFTTDNVFTAELQTHSSALQQQLQTMTDGVRCKVVEWLPNWDALSQQWIDPNYHFDVGCADIYTGLNETHDLQYPNGTYPLDPSICDVCNSDTGICNPDPTCAAQLNSDYNNFYQTYIQSVEDSARRNVLNELPLFDVQALIDTLALLSTPSSTDLTAGGTAQIFPPAASSILCLDVPFDSSLDWTQVQVFPCNAGTAQQWQYDRKSQTLFHPSTGKCLDVRGGDPTPGAAVQIYSCNGTDAQRWSWDPVSQVLRNALGNVLDCPGANFVPGQLLQSWSFNDGAAQQWSLWSP